VNGPHHLEPPPYAGVADLLRADDLPPPVLPPLPVPGPRSPLSEDAAGNDPAHAEAEAGEPLGHRVTRRFLTLCENPRTRARTMRLLQRSADSAVGGRLLVAFLSRMAFRPALRSRRLDHAASRIELACAQLGGVAVLRYVTKMEPVASMSVDDLVVMVGPGVEATLTAPFRGRAAGSAGLQAVGREEHPASVDSHPGTTKPRSRRGAGLGLVRGVVLRRG
jgi:hypothetical protein